MMNLIFTNPNKNCWKFYCFKWLFSHIEMFRFLYGSNFNYYNEGFVIYFILLSANSIEVKFNTLSANFYLLSYQIKKNIISKLIH